MPEIREAQLVAFYLFDFAERFDLQRVASLIGGPAVPARLVPKPATPAYIQYEKPPLSFEGELVGVPEVEGFRTRFRVYDYGIISLALTRRFEGDWSGLVAAGQNLIENVHLEQQAEALCRQLVATRLRPALVGYREDFLSEDYLVYAINELDRPMPASSANRSGS